MHFEMIWKLFFIYSAIFISESSSSEHIETQQFQQYIPNTDEIGYSQQRYHQIMQEPDAKWKDQKFKGEIFNVKEEIEKLNISYVYQPDWPDKTKQLGAVASVTFDRSGNVVVFHRGSHVWNSETFVPQFNTYSKIKDGPIKVNTIVAFDRKTGKVIYEWGKDMFYMPHGLTIDHENNFWVTDVALHQIMKFDDKGKLLMILGKKFKSGQGNDTFCKPTSVAILPNGDFFVADGYCNSRIMKFSAKGELILMWGKNTFQGSAHDVAPENFFAIPHDLTLAKNNTLLCVADRENGRIQCFYTTNGTFHSQYHDRVVGDRLFSVDYSPIEGGQFFVVNGPTNFNTGEPKHYDEVRGYVIDMKTKKVLSKFGPNDLQFSNPHDIAVSEDGNEIYVAEIDPKKVYKFLSKTIAKNTVFISVAKPTTTIAYSTESVGHVVVTRAPSGSTTVFAISLVSVFALLSFGIALLISRRRKRGCLPLGARNRRHAWDFPTVKPDGFKLGNLLDRKRGFEKLDQNASDEEPDASTNMLSSAQFA